jgi:hypothetical protein
MIKAKLCHGNAAKIKKLEQLLDIDVVQVC